jgi:hypothetical protein
MTQNSFNELNFLKNKIFLTLNLKNLKCHILNNKNKKNFSKLKFYLKNKILLFLKFFLENSYWFFLTEFITNYFFSKQSGIKNIENYSKEPVEITLKSLPLKELEKILEIIFKKAEKQVFKSMKILNFHHLKQSFFESKGNFTIPKKPQKEDENQNNFFNCFPEQFQIHIEQIRIDIDSLSIEISKIIINDIIKESFADGIFQKSKICFFESILRILIYLNRKSDSITKLYSIRYKTLVEIKNNLNYNVSEFFLIFFYFFNENSTSFYRIIYQILIINFFLIKKFLNLQFLFEFSYFEYPNWVVLKNLIFKEIKKNIRFSKYHSLNLEKDFKGKWIEISLKTFSKLKISIALENLKNFFGIDILDIQYWIHELNQKKKLSAKIDKLTGVVHFYKIK